MPLRLFFLISLFLSQILACNSTDIFIFDAGRQAIRSINRCDGVPCLYHGDCQNGLCLKRDLISSKEVEGVCITKTPEYTNCNFTMTDIQVRGNSFSRNISLNRCEFVPCLYDQECMSGHICYNNRYCL